MLRRANAISFGHQQLPTIDFARTRFAISFGADFLGTWNSPVAQSGAYAAMRQGRPGMRGAFVQVESRMSLTGASADEWVPVKPGTEGVLALGLAHVILAGKQPADAGRAGAAIDGWCAGLPDYTPAKVEAITGVPAKKIERLAHSARRADARRSRCRRRAARADQRPVHRARGQRAQPAARQPSGSRAGSSSRRAKLQV